MNFFYFSQTAFVNDLAHFGASIQLNKLYLLCEKDLLRVTKYTLPCKSNQNIQLTWP